METSIFKLKEVVPDDIMLSEALGELSSAWKEIRKYVIEVYPKATEEWNFPGAKFGWSFRIKDKKRAIIYLLPREKYFLVAFVYGEKATQAALESEVNIKIKNEIGSARVYAEGRGFRIEVKDNSLVEDIKKLVTIKIQH
jgi:hypothetical protein